MVNRKKGAGSGNGWWECGAGSGNGKSKGGDVTLSWGASCVGSDSDYAVYEGTLGDWDSHESKLCTTDGERTATFPPGPISSYYLVVPRHDSLEGSYGKDSSGGGRPPAATPCGYQSIGACP